MRGGEVRSGRSDSACAAADGVLRLVVAVVAPARRRQQRHADDRRGEGSRPRRRPGGPDGVGTGVERPNRRPRDRSDSSDQAHSVYSSGSDHRPRTLTTSMRAATDASSATHRAGRDGIAGNSCGRRAVPPVPSVDVPSLDDPPVDCPRSTSPPTVGPAIAVDVDVEVRPVAPDERAAWNAVLDTAFLRPARDQAADDAYWARHPVPPDKFVPATRGLRRPQARGHRARLLHRAQPAGRRGPRRRGASVASGCWRRIAAGACSPG